MRAEAVSNGPGDVPDNGQHVIASGYQHLYRYLTSVGTREHIAFPKSSTLRWPDGRKVTMQTTGLGAIRTLFGVHPDASWADRLRAARATALLGWQALRQPADLADLSTEQWFDRVGMPAPAREALWDWLALGIAAEPVAQDQVEVPVGGDVLGVELHDAAESPEGVLENRLALRPSRVAALLLGPLVERQAQLVEHPVVP